MPSPRKGKKLTAPKVVGFFLLTALVGFGIVELLVFLWPYIGWLLTQWFSAVLWAGVLSALCAPFDNARFH